MAGQTKKTASFGFQTVKEEERQSKVNDVFFSVAKRYDIMNDVMSAGTHRLWKKKLVGMLPYADGMQHLDVAGGTGDISFRVLEKAKAKNVQAHATVFDINAAMLEEGKRRAIDLNLQDRCTFKEGNAEKLPFKDESFDSYTVAFGIRNVTHRDKALKEAFRVLKTGGKFLCMEFSPVNQKGLKELYDFYSFNVIPKVGKAITKDEAAYQYLVESIRMFPEKPAFLEEVKKAGFAQCNYESLSLGAVAIHYGWKI